MRKNEDKYWRDDLIEESTIQPVVINFESDDPAHTNFFINFRATILLRNIAQLAFITFLYIYTRCMRMAFFDSYCMLISAH